MHNHLILRRFITSHSRTIQGGEETSWCVNAYNELKSNVDCGVPVNSEDPNQQFAIVSFDGGQTHYLYHPASSKFFSLDNEEYFVGMWAGDGTPVYFKAGAYANTYVMYLDSKHYVNVGGSKQMLINSWSTADGGNSCLFTPVGTYNPETMRWSKKSPWKYFGGGVLIISGSDAMSYASDEAPWTIFKPYITEINLPDGLTSIKGYAFNNCPNLTSIYIPSSVTSIGHEAFSGCSSLTAITIPENSTLTSIGWSAFNGCSSLTSINIPNSVTSIGYEAFSGCSSLTSINIPNSVTSIGNGAFDGCSSLTSINIPNSVTSIGWSAFYNCSSLKSITIPEDSKLTSIGNNAFQGCSSLTSINIPNSVTSIGDATFSGCSSLTSINIPEGVTSIGGNAFSGCSSLTSINIPNSVTSIGGSAFRDCSNLTEVHISSMDAWLNINYEGQCANPLTACWGGNLYLNGKLVTSVAIPEDITHIKDYTFDWCYSLTSVTLHREVTSMGAGSFSSCKNVKSFTSFAPTAPTTESELSQFAGAVLYYPDGGNYTSWQQYFGKSLPFITNINQLSNDKLYYVSQPYRNNTAWAVADNGANLVSNTQAGIAESSSDSRQLFAFVSNDGGNTLYMYHPAKKKFVSKEKEEEHGVLTDKPTDPIYFKAGAYDNTFMAYFDDEHYINVRSDEVLLVDSWKDPDGGNSNILVPVESFDPTEAIKAFGWSFNPANGHLVVTDDFSYDNVEDYPWHAYRSQIRSIEIKEGVTTIGAKAFYWCTNTSSVTIPSSVTGIGDCAFYDCSSLSSITIPDGVTTIGSYAFYLCSSLASVYISSMDAWLDIDFGGQCANPLTSRVFNTVRSGNNLYLNGNLVTELVIPEHITKIKDYAFDWCRSLEKVTLHRGVTSIGTASFSNCSNVKSFISFAPTVPTIEGLPQFTEAALYYPDGSNYAAWEQYFPRTLPIVTDIKQLSNEQIYYVSLPYCNNSSWAVAEAGTTLKTNTGISATASILDVRQQFAFISNDGGATHYIYSPVRKKFVNKEGVLTDKPTDPISFETDLNGGIFKVYFDDTHYVDVDAQGLVHIRNYSTLNGGSSFAIVPVSSFDPKDAFETFVVHVSSITLGQNAVTLKEEETFTLKATIAPTNATHQTVTWTSSDETVATVKNGVVTAVREGSATITATADGKSASCVITVKKKIIAVEKIVLSETEKTITKDGTFTLTATITPTNATNQTVTWTSSDETVATVKNGVVTAVREGSATITATADGKSASCAVTVEDPKDAEDPEDTEDPKDPEGSEDKEDKEDTKDPEDPEGSEGSEDTEDPKDPEGSEGSEDKEDPEGSEDKEDKEDKEDTTGVENSEIKDQKSAIIYDLTGRRILNTENLKPGLYIINGKKTVIK